jgi:surfactin synthase thioesterase subunit
LAEDVEVLAVQLPGREERSREPPFRCLYDVVCGVADAIVALDSELPFCLFGHSFGGLVAFEVMRELRRRKEHQPVGLLVSGRPAPSLGAVYPLYHLADDDLLRELLHMDPEIQAPLRTPAVFQDLLPRLRADLEICDSYAYNPEPPLILPIIAFAGRSDPVGTSDRIHAWQHETVGRFTCHVFDGGHFFLKSAWPLVANTLRTEMHRLVSDS